VDARVTENAPTPEPTTRRSCSDPSPRFGRFWLSPLNRRRWVEFHAQPARVVLALWLFLVLFLRPLVAEFIAHDKAILLLVNGRLISRVVTYPETTFCGDVETACVFTATPFCRKI